MIEDRDQPKIIWTDQEYDTSEQVGEIKLMSDTRTPKTETVVTTNRTIQCGGNDIKEGGPTDHAFSKEAIWLSQYERSHMAPTEWKKLYGSHRMKEAIWLSQNERSHMAPKEWKKQCGYNRKQQQFSSWMHRKSLTNLDTDEINSQNGTTRQKRRLNRNQSKRDST